MESVNQEGSIGENEMKTESENAAPEKEQANEEGGEVEEQQQEVVLVQRMPKHGTMFGRLHERNVTFCIDTSGSMIDCLKSVKEHVIEFLNQRAVEEVETKFNLIEFSTKVTQWSDKMVKCTPQTVAVASDWIRTLASQTGTNTLEALLTAFSDASTEAVCLITDSLPDQNPTDLLDSVIYAAQNRPVHCFFIHTGTPESVVTEFLQTLGMETYGSFHIITATDAGLVERITPIYRADATAERVIRTTDGNIYPSNHKICTVATRLGDIAHVPPGPATILVHKNLHPFYLYPWPYRYYYHHYFPYPYPSVGWSQYRPARALLSHEQDFYDSMINVCPGAGALVVGTKVLARRHADGLFYLGKVKSQILNNKFLVELGPCKHGKYIDTTYQETYIYDIVSYDDAMRHAVLTGDRVLAPWEPDGEHYGPGIVIEGQERRSASGGVPDQKLIVTFFNGKTAEVPLDVALWIPSQLYERINFEMHLPSHVRKEFAEQDDYPEENLAGYPTSGTKAYPHEYQVHESHWVPTRRNVAIEQGIYQHPYYVPLYPIYYKFKPKKSAVRSKEIEEVIPGTELTKSQLNEKVMSQIMKHKLSMEDSKVKDTESSEAKLLPKRESAQETSSVTKKSVTFSEGNASDLEAEFEAGDLDMRDSGRGSGDDLFLSDLEGEDSGKEETRTRSIGVGTNRKLFYQRRMQRSADKRPPWRYWKNEPSPDVMEPLHYGPYRVGPYDETYVAPPMECRNTWRNAHAVEWTSPLSKVIDPYAKYNYKTDVKDAMCIPRPPEHSPEKQKPGCDLSEILGMPLTTKECLAISRQDFRRSRALQREMDWVQSLEERERMRLSMEDQHRARVMARLDYETQRQKDQIEAIQRTREARKQISDDIRARIEENQNREKETAEQRLAARAALRERREQIVAQRQKEIEETISRRQAIREQNAARQWDGVRQQLAEMDAEAAAAADRHRAAVRRRIEHFRDLENEAQQRKQLQHHVAEHSHYNLKSQIFP